MAQGGKNMFTFKELDTRFKLDYNANGELKKGMYQGVKQNYEFISLSADDTNKLYSEQKDLSIACCLDFPSFQQDDACKKYIAFFDVEYAPVSSLYTGLKWNGETYKFDEQAYRKVYDKKLTCYEIYLESATGNGFVLEIAPTDYSKYGLDLTLKPCKEGNNDEPWEDGDFLKMKTNPPFIKQTLEAVNAWTDFVVENVPYVA
jgi:hypothetical protein